MTISAAKQSQKPLFCLCTVPSRYVFLVPLSRSPYIIASIAASFAAINTLTKDKTMQQSKNKNNAKTLILFWLMGLLLFILT